MYTIINGFNPIATFIAGELKSLDANVRLYGSRSQFKEAINLLSIESFQNNNWTQEFISKHNIRTIETLIQTLENEGLLVASEIKSVGKKFLKKNELASNRMKDLFRVISLSEVKEDVEGSDATEEDNSQLMADFKKSLSMEREHFDDCDFFIDTTNSVGSSESYRPVNLEILKNEERFIDIKELKKFPDGRICLIGDGEEVANLILNNRAWFFNLKNHLDIICHYNVPFGALKNESLKNDLFSFFDELESFINKEFEDYRKRVFEEREKGLKLNEPEPEESLSFFLGYSALIFDKLYDREDFYITLERPEFRAKADLKTIHSDFLCVENVEEHLSSDSKSNLEDESGLFKFDFRELDEARTSEKFLEIKEKMLRYFSHNA